MLTLADHLAALNTKTKAWVAEDPDNRWAGLYVEDLSHWAEMGITTVKQFERYEMETSIWDLYKDVTGIRPRGYDFKSMSDDELTKMYDYLVKELELANEREKEYLAHMEEVEAQDAAERAARLAEMPEKIDYVACKYQEGWL